MEALQNSEETSKAEAKLEFKKPVLIGRIGKLPKKAKPDAGKPPEATKDEEPAKKEPSENTSNTSSKSSLPPSVLLKEMSTPIPYKEPKWSGLCPDGKTLE